MLERDEAVRRESGVALSKNQVEWRRNELDVEGEARLFRALRHFWHPVVASSEVTSAPTRVWLCGAAVVIVRLGDKICAFNDLCAHRGTALSLGSVVDGPTGPELRCAYHGWQYAADGHCTFIPQRPDLAGHVRAQIRQYRAQERYGLAWVCLADEPHFPIPEFPEYDDPAYHTVHFPQVDWNCSVARRVENYIDVAHFAFVHDGWLGDIQHPEIAPHRVWRGDRTLHMAEDEPVYHPAQYSKWKGATPNAEGMIEVRYERTVFVPATVRLDIKASDRSYVQFFHPSPMTQGSVRNFTIVARNFGDPSTIVADHADFNMVVYEQDRPIVESQRPEQLPEDLSYEMHTKGVDTYTLEYRRWLIDLARTLGDAGGPRP